MPEANKTLSEAERIGLVLNAIGRAKWLAASISGEHAKQLAALCSSGGVVSRDAHRKAPGIIADFGHTMKAQISGLNAEEE